MNCRKAKILISAAMDGELTLQESQALERHISRCNACATEKEEFASLSTAMRAWPDAEPSAWLAQSFACKLQDLCNETTIKSPRRPRWVLGSVATGFAAAAVAAVMLLHTPIAPVHNTKQAMPPLAANTSAVPPTVQPLTDKSVPTVKEPKSKPVLVARNTQPQVDHSSAKTTSSPVKHHSYAKPHRFNGEGMVVAYAPQSVPSYNSDTASDQTSSSEDQTRDEAVLMIVKNLAAANEANGEATGTVKNSLAQASMAMDQTVETVRGTLRQAADILLENNEQPAADTEDSNGGITR